MPAPTPLAQLPETTVSLGRSFLAVAALWAGLALPVLGQTTEPTSTTATYGNWTVRCATSVPQTTDRQPPVKVCEMTTRLTLKGNDGQTRPLLQIAIGRPPGAETTRIVLQVPVDVALREPVTVSLDQAAASEEAPKTAPKEPVLSATYLSCSPRGCLAETEIAADVVGRLRAAQTMNVSFASLVGDKRIIVPVPLAGFAEAAAALELANK